MDSVAMDSVVMVRVAMDIKHQRVEYLMFFKQKQTRRAIYNR